MRELTVHEVRVSTSGGSPVVVLREVDGERLLPIWMSAGGAAAIVSATESGDPARPCVHDLVGELLAAIAVDLEQVRIVGFEDGQFYAELVLQGAVLPARPSDAIALALRAGCQILCEEHVMDEAAVLAEAEPPAAPDDEVEKFREFLDSVNPDDF